MFWAILAVLGVLVLLNLSLLTRLRSQSGSESRLREDLARLAQRQSEDSRALREEVSNGILRFASQSAERSDALREVIDRRLEFLHTDNARRLEEMRATVDDKLQSTREARLCEAFRLVSERLEQVHRG